MPANEWAHQGGSHHHGRTVRDRAGIVACECCARADRGFEIRRVGPFTQKILTALILLIIKFRFSTLKTLTAL